MSTLMINYTSCDGAKYSIGSKKCNICNKCTKSEQSVAAMIRIFLELIVCHATHWNAIYALRSLKCNSYIDSLHSYFGCTLFA